MILVMMMMMILMMMILMMMTRDPSYTYDNFLKAVAKFPSVCSLKTDLSNCRTLLATMFAHFAQETGQHNLASGTPEWRQGLYHLEEVRLTPYLH